MEKTNFFHYLRTVRNISQEKVAKDLEINQSTLSRYERGETKMPHELFLSFLNYFNVDHYDYLEYSIEFSEEYRHNKIYFKNTFTPNEVEINYVYKYFSTNKNKSYYNFLKYIKTKTFWHRKFPSTVPDITSEEFNQLSQYLKDLKYYSHQDYDLLGTISPRMNINDLNQVVDLMVLSLDFDTFRVTASEKKLKFVAVILNNAIDRNINAENFENATILLNKLKNYLSSVENTTMQLMVPFYEILIKSEFDFTEKDIQDIGSVIKAINFLGFSSLATTLKSEYIKYLTGEQLDHFEKSFFFDF